MRFIILMALCGLAAAWYPTGTSQSQAFNQMLQNMQYGRVNNLANQLNVDEEDLVDSDQEDIQEQLQQLLQQQRQQQQCYPDQEDEDTEEDEEDEYQTYQDQTKYGGAQNAKQAQQQCIQKQQECAQAQQQATQNPHNKQKANKAHQKCAHAAQKCDQAQQQSQNQNQQKGGQDQQQQGANAQQQCANAQQQCANAQQQIANTKKHQGQNPQQQQQAANAQQQCSNAQQQCANALQQYANTQQQNGVQNQQQQQQQEAANQQQQCANAQQKCADAQQAAANTAQQGYGNQQQQNHAQQKCAQAQQKCAQAQHQSAQAQNQAAQDPQQVQQNPQCVKAQQKCGEAQQQCSKAHQQCNQAQQTGNQQACTQTQKQCAKKQQQCAQAQKPCQSQGPNQGEDETEEYNTYNKYQTGNKHNKYRTGQHNKYQNQYDDDEETTQYGGNPIQPNYQALHQLEHPNSQLAAKLYKQAKQERDDKNTVVSPASVQLALAALQKGAKGNTKAQIKRVQCAGMDQQKCQQAHAALIRALKGSNNVQQTQKQGQPNSGSQKAKINVPNAIVVNQQTPPRPQYTQAVQKGLGGQVKTCQFKHTPQQCRKQINQLISARTNHKLKQTVPRDAVTDNTKMIAVSAAQLQAKWGQQFRQNQRTKKANFYPLGNQQPKQCQAIESKGVFNYYEDEQVQVVGIPTQQQELTVYVIVPKDQDGLNQVEKSQIQNGQQLKQLLETTDQQQQYVKVQIPKFQAKHKLDAKKTLQQQGVQDAFDNDQADFSGINNQQQQQQTGKQIHLNKLIHQATIKVNEQGITAATPNNQNDDQDTQEEYQEKYTRKQKYQQDEDDEDDEDQESQYGQQYKKKYDEEDDERTGQENKVKANHAFAFAVKHNPSNQIVLVGRVVDGCQKPNQQNQGTQDGTVDGVDQD